MRAVLSEQAVAMMGRWGCGVLSQVRVLQVGWKVARALMAGIVVGGQVGIAIGRVLSREALLGNLGRRCDSVALFTCPRSFPE